MKPLSLRRFFILLLFAATPLAFAANRTYDSTTCGGGGTNFNNDACWNAVPVAGDNLTIKGSCTFNGSNFVTAGTATSGTAYGTLTLGANPSTSGSISMTGGTLNVSTFNASTGGGGTFSQASGTTLQIRTGWTITNTSFTPGSGTAAVNWNNTTGASTLPITTFNVLQINATGQTASLGGTTSAASIAVNAGTLAATTNTLTATGAVSGSGTLSFSSGTLNIGGNLTVSTFTAGTSTVNANGSSAQSLNGYALNNLTINNSGGVSLSGATTVSGTLTLTSGALANGANLTLGNGATISRSAGTLGSAPTFGTSVNVTYTNGSGITTGNELPVSTSVLSNLSLSGTNTVTLGASATVNGTLSLGSNVLATGANTVTVAAAGTVTRTSGRVNGTLAKTFNTGTQSFTYDIGDAVNYAPVALTSFVVTGSGTVSAKTTGSDHPQIATSGLQSTKDANRYWTLGNSGATFSSVSAAFNFVAGDLDGAATPANFVVKRYNGSTWSPETVGTVTSTSTQAIGITSLGSGDDFAAGEENPTTNFLVSAPASTTAGNSFSVTVTARDSGNRTTTKYAGTVTFTSSDPQAVLPANYTFTGAGSGKDNGVHTFSNNFTLKTSGNRTVTATDSGITGTSGTIAVSPASANSISKNAGDTQTGNVAATLGTALQVKVTDAFGNNVADGTSITFTPQSGSGSVSPTTATTTSGLASTTWTLGCTTGSESVVASVTSNSSINTTFTATVNETSRSSVSSGNWTTPSIWSPACAPASGSDVTINAGHAITLDTASATIASLTFSAATSNSSLDLNGNTLTSSGAVHLNQPSTTSVSETLTVGSGTLNATSIALDGSGNKRTDLTVSTGTVNDSGDITFNNSPAQTLQITGAGNFNIGGNFGGNGSFNFSSAATITFNGTGAQTIGSYNSGNALPNVVINKTSGSVTAGTNLTIAGNLTIQSSTSSFTAGNNLGLNGNFTDNGTFSSPGTVTFGGSSAQTLSGTAAGTSGSVAFTNLTMNNGNGLTLSTPASVSGLLTFTIGNITTGSNTLTLGGAGSVAQTSGYVIGNFAKVFAAAASKTFEIGTANGYSPVTVNATAGTFPGTFTAKATQAAHPNAPGSDTLQRYWTLTNGTITSADLTFTYLASDIIGTEAAYSLGRWTGSAWVYPTSSLNTVSHIASTTGATNFGDYTLNERASKLVITSVNGGVSPITAGNTFNVVVQAQNADGHATAVASSTNIQLSVNTGTPAALGGTLTGTITAGNNSVTISGVTYTKAESGITLLASATAGDTLTAGTSASFTVIAAAANKLGFAQQPTDAVAGVAISPAITVQVQDTFGNLVTTDTRNVTLAISNNPGGGALSGTTTVAASGGVATFSSLSINKTGTGYTLAATSSPALTGATSNGFNITPAAANHLTFLQQPTNAVAGVAISPAITVRIEDSFNNLVTSDTRNVTLAIGTNAGGGTLSGTTTQAASGGIATFSDLSINKTGTGYTLAAISSPVLTGATSTTFNITFAAADHLTFLQQPTNAVAGVAISPAITVRVEDVFGNLVTTDTRNVTLAIANNAGGGTLSGTTTQAAAGGIATFNNLSINKTGTGYTLGATSSPALTGATSTGFDITPAAPNHLTFLQQPTNTVAGVAISPAITVRVEDVFGNLVTTDTRNVTLAISTNPGGGTLSGTTTQAASGGVATFNDLSINKTGIGYTLAATSSPVLTGATSTGFNITPAASDHLTFLQQPSNAVAGVAISPAITVRVEDAFGNLVTTDTRNVTLAIANNAGGGTLSGTTTQAASGGVATFNDLSINKTGTGYTLAATSTPSLTGATSTTFNITPAAPDHLTFLQQPTTTVAGVAIAPAITVRIEDAFGNLVPTDTRNVTLAIASNPGSGTLSGTTTQAASGGIATFNNLSINKTGTGYTLAATSSPALTGATSTTFDITPAAPDHLTFLQQPTDAVAGVAISPAITVRVEDQFNNLVTSDTRNVTLAIGTNPGGGTLSGTTTQAASGGVATFNDLFIDKSGTGYTLAATSSPALTGATSTTFNISPAAPDHLTFAQQPSDATAGVAISPAITVRVEDVFGNLVTTDTRNVTLAISANPGGGTLSGTTTQAAVGGVATFNDLSINKSGTGYTLAATSSPVLTGATSNGFNITPAAADHLTFLQQPTTAAAGVAIAPPITVRIEDAFGNLVTPDSTTQVTLAIANNAGGGTLSGTTTQTASSGIATFNDLSINKTGTGYTLGATSSPALTGATSTGFDITPAAPNHLRFLQQPTNTVAGVAISPAVTVRVEDVFDNLVTSDTRNVTLAIGTNAGGGTLSGTTTQAASGGIATFNDLSINKSGTGYTLGATSSPALTGATSTAFNITFAAADHLTFLQQPTTAVAGVAISPAITVRVEDVFGNLVTNDTRNVTLAIANNAGGGTLSGTTTVAASGGIATFSNLSIDKTGTGYTLGATSSPALTGATSTGFDITPAAPDHLTFLQQPTNTVAGVTIAPAITVRIEDVFGNLVTTDTRNVTLAIANNAGGGTLSGTTTQAAIGGIATFNDLSINKTGTGYTLGATSSPALTGATSTGFDITPAAPDHLTFLQQPTNTVAGVAISPAITVRVEDAFGNLVTTDTRNVTLAIGTNAGGGTLSGTTTQAASGGIATFNDLSINKSGTGYTLGATSSPALTGATSTTFNITFAAADHLTFLQQPTTAVAGVAIAPAITVRVEDVFGNLVTNDTRNVTLAIANNAGGGTLSGTTTVAASGGIATFNDLSINKTGTGYTLGATSSPALTGATSTGFDITPAAPDHLTFLQQPSNTVAGVAISPAITVRVEDVFGNLVTTDTRNVTLAIGTNPGGGTLSGTTTQAASGGIATFNDLSINKSGTGYTLAATSSPALTGATSTTFNITFAAADHLTFLQQPTNTVAGVAISPAITVRVEDAFGNLVTTDTRNVTLAIGTNAGGGSLSGTTTQAASGGIATFNDLSINKTGVGYTLAATSSPVLTGATSTTFNITFAAANHLTFLQQPTTAVAGVAISPAITVRVDDVFGNLVTNDTRNVTLAIGTNPGGGTLSGTATQAASGGIATFSNLSIDKSGTGYTLGATSSPALTGATSTGFDITPAAPDHLTFLQQPTNTVAGVAIAPAITVRVEDVFGNLVTTDTRNVTLAIANNAGGGTLSGTTTQAAIGGVATFNDLSINKTGTGYTLGATSSPALAGATSTGFDITPAASDHLTFLQQPTNTVAGVAISPAITVRVEDAFGNLVTTDTRNVTLAIGTNAGGGTLSGTTTQAASGGIATFNDLSINKSGIGYTLAATSSPVLTGATSGSFNITFAAANHLTFLQQPTNTVAGVAISPAITVRIEDAFGNLVTTDTRNVTLAIGTNPGGGTLSGTTTQAASGGIATFSNLSIDKTGTGYTLGATSSPALTGATSTSFNITFAAADHLTFLQQPTNAVAGVAIAPAITVRIEDAFGNLVTTDTRNVTLAIGTNAGGGTLSGTATVAASGGIATFSNLSIDRSGSGYTLNATSSPALTGAASSGFDISPAAADHLTYLQQPSDAVAGVAISPAITVRIEDVFGNLVTTDTRNVTLAIGTNPGGGTLSGTATQAAIGGVATFNDLSINKTGTGYTLAATSSPALPGATSATFNITFAAADHLTFLQQPTTAVAGVAISPAITVRVEDAFGNLVTTDTRNVTLAIGTNAGGGTLSGTTTQAASGGIATFSNLSINKSGNGYTLAATSSPTLTSATSTTFNITFAAADHLTFLQQPSNAVAGVAISPAITVRIEDAFGNLVTTDTRNVTLAIGTNPGGGTLSGTATVAASGGIATFSTLSIDKSGTGYTLGATSSPALTGATSTTFNITFAAANHLTFLQQPTNTVAGVAISPAITVRVEDAFGNLVTNDTRNVTLAIGTNPGGGTLSGTTTVAASGGVATFSTLSIDKSGTGYTLGATSSPALTGATSTTFNITFAAANHLTFLQQPTNAVAGVAISPAITVRIEDAFGNLVTSDTRNVTLAIGTNPGGGTLSGTATVAASGGIATFSTLSIDKSGTGYTLAATSSPALTGAASASFNISAAAANKLVFGQQPSNTVAGVAITPAVTVQVQDAFGNTVTADSTTQVTLAIGTNPGGGTLSGTATVTASSGVATFSTLSIDKSGNGYTLAATSTPSLTSATSTTFNITPAAASKLVFLQQPTDAVAGTAIAPAVTVRVEDAFSNVVTTDNTTQVTLAIGTNPGGGTLSGTATVTASSGVATFSTLSIDKSGNGYTLAATSTPSLAGATSSTFNILPGALDHFLVEAAGGGSIAPQIAGNAFNIRITAQDVNNNTVTSFNGTVQLTSNATLSGAPVTTAAFTNGVLASQAVTITSAQTGTTISATDTGSGKNGTSNAFTVNPAGAANFLVESGAGGNIPPQIAGVPFNIRLTVRDAFGNTVTGFTGVVSLTSNAGAVSPLSTTFVSGDNGVKTVSVTIDNANAAATITATSGANTGTSNAFTIAPAGLANFLVEAGGGGSIGPQTAGTPFTIQVTARDAFGNTATGYTGTVTLTTTAGTISPTPITFTGADNGVKSVSVTVTASGTGKTITASDGTGAGTSNAFTVNAGALNHFLVEAAAGGNIGTQAAGTPFSIRITALDGNNNTVPSFNGTVDVTSTGALSNGGGTSPAFTNGVLASLSVTISNSGSFTITATRTGGAETGTSNSFTVASGGDMRILISGPASAPPASTQLYTITVTNLGPATATGVNVSLTLPSGWSISSVTGACSALPCGLGTFTSGQSATINANLTTGSINAVPYSIVTNVTSTSSDPNNSNDSATASTLVQVANCPVMGNFSPANNANGVALHTILSWSASFADSYTVYFGEGSGGCTHLYGTVTSPFVNISGLTPGTTYTWMVVANHAGCPSVPSGCMTFTTASVCNAPPLTLSAIAEASSKATYHVSWGDTGASMYEVQESTTNTFAPADTFHTSSTQLTFNHEVITTTAFYYRARAVLSACGGVSANYSDPIRVVVVPTVTTNGTEFDLFVEAGSNETITQTVHLDPLPIALAGKTSSGFIAKSDQSWLFVTPGTGNLPADIALSANAASLSAGTWVAMVHVTDSAGTPIETIKLSLNVLEPMSIGGKDVPPPNASIIPGVAHAAGIGSQWQSDVRIYNPSSKSAKYLLLFTPAGADGTKVGRRATLDVPAHATVALDDIVRHQFGLGALDDDATGALEIRPVASNDKAIVTSRTYNVAFTGTYGQFIPAFAVPSFAGMGDTMSLQQVAQSDAYRTNVGFVEASGLGSALEIRIYDDGGHLLKTTTALLDPFEQTQIGSMIAQQGLALADGRIEVDVKTPGAKVVAYASVVDNKTSDPLLVSPAIPAHVSETRYVIPGVADFTTPAVAWRSDVRIYNSAKTQAVADLTFYTDGQSPVTRSIVVAPGEVKAYDNILQSLFGLTGVGGALHVSTASASALVVTARTYDGHSAGTYGQFIPALTSSDGAVAGGRSLEILGVEQSDLYRANIGVVEIGGKAANVDITVTLPDGRSATSSVSLAPYQFIQFNSLAKALGFDSATNVRVAIAVTGGQGRVAGYASVIDNRTQDPTYIPAQ